MSKQNFLLGRGERLTADIVVASGGGRKEKPYSFSEARNRLKPLLSETVKSVEKIPTEACPDNQAVISLTLNPEFIAKSYYPSDLFSAVGLEPVGSRIARVTPEKRSKNRTPLETNTTEFFVMASRPALKKWEEDLLTWQEKSKGAEGLRAIEKISVPTPKKKIKGRLPKQGQTAFEIVLHTDELRGETQLLPSFQAYLKHIGIESKLTKRFYAGGLCFVELDAPVELAEKIATFTVVRALRQMPKLRVLRPTIRSASIPSQSAKLPSGGPIDSSIKVAIFDGGVSNKHPLTNWVTPIDAPNVGEKHDDYIQHGTAVTSAYLFGHLDPTITAPRPYAPADHYRVLDNTPGQNPHELYEVLERIQNVLETKKYDFINLSLGPCLPIEDDEVHAWTAVLDDWLARNDTLATIAVGNDGEGDSLLGLDRIQVPADCVNALAVGACDSHNLTSWERAPYSSIGPGRSPGLVKPDLVAFGGVIQRPFLVVDKDTTPLITSTGGTSFSAPSALRLGAGIRAHFGTNLGMLSIRALLIHSAESKKDISQNEIGWGRLAQSLDDIVLCGDDTIRIVYQGTLTASKYVRAPIPLPTTPLTGKVNIKATICYSTSTDPHHPDNYTRAGLEIIFRPHDQKRKDSKQLHANGKSFFGKTLKNLSEDDLRRDAKKWESCQHASHNFAGKSLVNPVFDIHYLSRFEGHAYNPEQQLRYALVVTVQAKNIKDLYDQVVRRYATILEPLRPVVEIPIRARSS